MSSKEEKDIGIIKDLIEALSSSKDSKESKFMEVELRKRIKKLFDSYSQSIDTIQSQINQLIESLNGKIEWYEESKKERDRIKSDRENSAAEMLKIIHPNKGLFSPEFNEFMESIFIAIENETGNESGSGLSEFTLDRLELDFDEKIRTLKTQKAMREATAQLEKDSETQHFKGEMQEPDNEILDI